MFLIQNLFCKSAHRAASCPKYTPHSRLVLNAAALKYTNPHGIPLLPLNPCSQCQIVRRCAFHPRLLPHTSSPRQTICAPNLNKPPPPPKIRGTVRLTMNFPAVQS